MKSLFGFCLESKRSSDIQRRHQHFHDCVFNAELDKVERWLLNDKTIKINEPCFKYSDVYTPLFYLLQNMIYISLNKPKKWINTIKLMLEMGANTDLKWNTVGWFPNYGLQYIVKNRLPNEVLQLFLNSRKRFNINESSNSDNCLFAFCLQHPNYKKFQLLLCHGLTLDKRSMVKFLPRMERNYYYKRKWRKNQNKRKTSALIKSWPAFMLLYCLLKVNVSPTILDL